jgi:hypothetical protein
MSDLWGRSPKSYLNVFPVEIMVLYLYFQWKRVYYIWFNDFLLINNFLSKNYTILSWSGNMGRKRKLSNGKILTAYVDYDEYMQILMLASKLNRSVSETVRLLILNGLASHSMGGLKSVNGGKLNDNLIQIRNDLLIEEAWEKLENLRKLVNKLENTIPSQKMTLKYYELKQTVRKNAVELIDYINGNKINDEKLIREATNILKKINNK